MAEKKKVLILEDDEANEREDDQLMRKFWEFRLQDKVNIIFAGNVPELEREYVDNTDLDVIVVAPHHLRNVALVKKLLEKEMRQNFTGPIIVTTGDNNTRDNLLQAGCNHWCEKRNLPETVLRILGL
jgi:hypothetical protein